MFRNFTQKNLHRSKLNFVVFTNRKRSTVGNTLTVDKSSVGRTGISHEKHFLRIQNKRGVNFGNAFIFNYQIIFAGSAYANSLFVFIKFDFKHFAFSADGKFSNKNFTLFLNRLRFRVYILQLHLRNCYIYFRFAFIFAKFAETR